MKVLGFCNKCNNSITMTDFVDPDVGLFECAKCHTFIPSQDLKSVGVMGIHYEDEHLHSLYSEDVETEKKSYSTVSNHVNDVMNTKRGSIKNVMRLCTLEDIVDNFEFQEMVKLHRLIKKKMADHVNFDNTHF